VTGGTKVETSTVVHKPATIYAHWTPVSASSAPYEISFFSPDDATLYAKAMTGANGILAAANWPAEPTIQNRLFTGWYTDAMGVTTNVPPVPENHEFTTPTELYAHWENRYTVTFRYNGGTDGGTESEKIVLTDVPGGRLSSFPEVTRQNYTFKGWFILSPLGDVEVNLGMGVLSGLGNDLTAKWEWSAEPYTITFNPNGGTFESTDPTSAATAVEFKLALMPTTPTAPAGKEFDNWWTLQTGGEFVNLSYVFSGNTTIYAHWKEGTWEPTFTYGGIDYKKIKIGEQVWMAENLNYAGENGDLGVCYGNDPANCAIYGRLYTLDEAKQACPTNWHLANNDDWNVLANGLGGLNATTGTKLRSSQYWNPPGKSGADGFNALPGGSGTNGTSFSNIGTQAHFISFNAETSAESRFRISTTAASFLGGVNFMGSVRCVQD
jgi:uncharacterized protein (TIGR02145 family)/uncharacterized repeat protein (TIGR02543 family)